MAMPKEYAQVSRPLPGTGTLQLEAKPIDVQGTSQALPQTHLRERLKSLAFLGRLPGSRENHADAPVAMGKACQNGIPFFGCLSLSWNRNPSKVEERATATGQLGKKKPRVRRLSRPESLSREVRESRDAPILPLLT